MVYIDRTDVTKKTLALLFGAVLVLFIIYPLSIIKVNAGYLVGRSVVLRNSRASAVTRHSFSFNTATSNSIGSLVLEYCTNSPNHADACSVPAGLSASGATIATQTGIAGLSVHIDSLPNRVILTRTASVIGLVSVNIALDNITNPSGVDQSVFVRISTYGSTDGSGTPNDFGSVVFSIVSGIGVGGYVPPYLTFCAGVTVALDCSDSTGSLLALGELSSNSPRVATSQYSGYTNDPTGFVTYLSGSTLTAGNKIIPALSSNGSSVTGTSQFGVNLRSNSIPNVGANVSGGGSSVARPNYNSINSFRFVDGESISSSTLPTLPNRFTVSYVVNISEEQAVGLYTATFTFTAVASF